ncbi:M3 family oligoendopeptidase [Haloarchaeobius sp. HME9146]|uniref:M3 family oligoendopeptidase n=1 Tax=Haloarchaeobius sp. HME9146 TaxID=2978732 RepID=UPI0021C00DC7|nr:M3 family metallopeptidase [Haloarchaeobius sp. HME9146]MCT9097652.1 M3 family metallopeptidase [Haloarchaeobius sp. HME9146]
MNSLPSRSAIDAEYRWDRSLVFETDEAWEAAFESLESRVETFDPVDESVVEDGQALRDALERREALLRERGPVWLYPQLKLLVDTDDEAAERRRERARGLRARIDGLFSGLEPAIQQAGRDHVERLLAETPELETYEHFLDDALRRAAHTLSPAEEDLLTDLEDALDAPSRVLERIDSAAVEARTVEVGDETLTVTGQSFGRLLSHQDREVRRQVHHAYRDALSEHRIATAQAYAEHLRSAATRARVRDYDSAIDMATDDLPTEVHEALTDAVLENYDPFARRLEYIREDLDGDDLHNWDRAAPLATGDGPEIPYDEGVEHVLAAVEPLGSDYQDRLADLLDQRRVDVYETQEKRGIVAAAFGSYEVGSFVHLNYADDLWSLLFFVHELGHVMHKDHFDAAQPTTYQSYPDHVAEIASFCHEALLVRHLLDTFEAEADRRHVLDTFTRKLPMLAAARGMAFVRQLFRDIESGETLTADHIDARNLETMRRFYPDVTFDDADATLWMSQNLDREPCHAYWYLLGSVGGLATASRLLDGDLAPETYRDFLRAGSSEYAVTLLDRLGLSVRDGSMVATGIEQYDEYLDALAE